MRARQLRQWLLALALAASVGCKGAKVAPPAVEPGEYTVELNGLKLWYKVSGAGPVCLMPTPAWGSSSDLYFRTLTPLEATFRIVYLDSRGTGRSERAATAADYTWDHLVADLDGLRGHLKQEKVWLMGHSEGGMQVLHYACKYPDRVAGLVLLSTAAVTDARHGADVTARAERRKEQPWYPEAMRALRTMPKTDEEFTELSRMFLPLYWSEPGKIDKFKNDFAATSLSVEAKRGRVESKRFPFDLTDQLKKVSAPALVVVGDDDFICSPEAAQRLHLSLAHSKLLLIEKCGHFPWMEQPEVFQARVPESLAALGLSGKP